MCVRMLYLLAEELYRDFPWCQRSMKSLRSEAKKKHVQLVEIVAISEIPETDAEAVVMLLCSTQSWVERRIAEANARNVHPVALYNCSRRPEHACSVVTMDIDEAMRLAIDYLRSIGCTQLALYAVNPEATSDPCRMETFLSCTDAQPTDCYALNGSLSRTFADFRPHLGRYDGVICTNDYAAASLLHNLQCAGVERWPHVISFGNMEICTFFKPTITSISDDYEHFGAAALSIYRSVLREKYISTVEISLHSRLHIRDSTGNLPYRQQAREDHGPGVERENLFFRDPDVDRMRKMELLFNYCDELDLQILHLLEKNCSYAAISEALFASETAVKYRVRNMENLCGVNSRAELKALLWGVF